MKRVLAAILLILSLTPSALHAQGAETGPALVQKVRAQLIGKWLSDTGETMAFDENGGVIAINPAFQADLYQPKELKGKYEVTPDLQLRLALIWKTMVTEFTVDSEALRIKTPLGRFAQYKRYTTRSAADFILAEIGGLDSAIDQWAIENNKRGGERPTAAELQKYARPESRLFYALKDPAGPKDLLGNPYGELVVDKVPKLHPDTIRAIGDAVPREFWKKYIEVPLTPAAAHAQDAELAAVRKVRATLIGKWIHLSGQTMTFEETGAVILRGPQPGKEVKGTFGLISSRQVQIVMAGKTMRHDFTADAETLRLKVSQERFMESRRYTPKVLADHTLAEMRILGAAIDRWAVEKGKQTGDRPTSADLLPYIPKGIRLAYVLALNDAAGPKDLAGNSYGQLAVAKGPKIHPETARLVGDAVPREFWNGYID